MAETVEEKQSSGAVKSYLEWSDKGKSSIFRYLVGTILVLIAFFALAGIGVVPFTLINPDYKNSIIDSNLVLLAAFIIPFFLIPLITKWINKRPFWSVAMPRWGFEKWNFFTGFFVATTVGITLTFVFNLMGLLNLEYVGFNWSSLIILAIIGLVGIFIQASTEEMLFLGYLTQFVRRITKNPIVFLTIPALLFALPHISNVSELGGGI